jgi:hypothetical protein
LPWCFFGVAGRRDTPIKPNRLGEVDLRAALTTPALAHLRRYCSAHLRRRAFWTKGLGVDLIDERAALDAP